MSYRYKPYTRVEKFVELHAPFIMKDHDVWATENRILNMIMEEERAWTEKDVRCVIGTEMMQRGYSSYIHPNFPLPIVLDFRIRTLFGEDCSLDDVLIDRLHSEAEISDRGFDDVWAEFKNGYEYNGMHPDMRRRYMKDLWMAKEEEEKAVIEKKKAISRKRKRCVLDETDQELLDILSYLEKDNDDDSQKENNNNNNNKKPKKKKKKVKVDLDLTKDDDDGSVDIDLTVDDD